MNKISKLMLSSGFAVMLGACSPNKFLDAIPKDALSPETAWQTHKDIESFLTGAYDGWQSGSEILNLDCASDFGFNFHRHEGWRSIGDGTLTTSNPGSGFYGFATIHRCNNLLKNIDRVTYADPAVKANIIGQARFIRASRYFKILWHYGKGPIIDTYETADEAKVAPSDEATLRAFVEKELDEAIEQLSERPMKRGAVGKGAAMALRMRMALYYGDYAKAKSMAEAIIALGQYELDPSYENLFSLAGQGSREIILAVQHLESVKPLWTSIGSMYNNSEGGWSSMVPTKALVDTYEMANGRTTDDPASGYDARHPFKGRDPRMAMTLLYPGAEYINGKGNRVIYNTLDAKIAGANNVDYPDLANNCSKTGLTWRKYTYPIAQYRDIWAAAVNPIVFRYAEVLLSAAEAENELSGPSEAVYSRLNLVRARVGMPEVDRTRYATKETLRELIRRERGVELAGEGLRRADIVRWRDASGKMLAETVLNGDLVRYTGTVDMAGTDAETRATIESATVKVETRTFAPHMRYLPLSQTALDNNPQLKATPGY